MQSAQRVKQMPQHTGIDQRVIMVRQHAPGQRLPSAFGHGTQQPARKILHSFDGVPDVRPVLETGRR